MKVLLGAAAAAAVTLLGTAASAQPYGYYGGFQDYRPSYGYSYGYNYGPAYNYGYSPRYTRSHYRDSDRDGVPDRAEWGRDRDRDGRPDQWDRYDNRRSHWGHRGYGYTSGWRY